MKVDVLVIGGGSAGLAAAVTAARSGARTLMVERAGMAGGMGTLSLVHTFCGLYHLDGDRARIANPGLSDEIATRMERATGSGPVKMGRCWVLPQHPVEFARIADQLLRESGVECWYHSELMALREQWTATVACRGGFREVSARSVVDASGDAVGAALLGLSDERATVDRLQRPAYVFGVQGVQGGIDGLSLAGIIVEGVRSGELPASALGLHFRSSGRSREVFGTLDLTGEETGDYDPTDPRCLSELEYLGREVAGSTVKYLSAHTEGWGQAYVSHWPARAGVRESRRWSGREVLRGEDVLRGARREDEVALATWPLEMRETNRGPRLRYPDEGLAAGIPRGALIAENLSRVFVAGRCISCDHEAQASIRVMGTCFATGEAAGKMASAED